MAKQNASVEPHGLLRGFIDAINHLVIMIASRLRHMQILRSAMGSAKGDYDIWQKLGSHMEQISAESQPDTEPRTIKKGKSTTHHRQDHAATTAQELNRLTEHGKRKAVNRLLSPMNEHMQSKTMEHINISLILAKEGNTDGAKLHIDLAENAMHTASRFMSHEDYEIFEKKVEHRLESIMDRDLSSDSGA